MPLPYTLRYEGLATALYAQLEASGLPFNMTYQAWLTIARRDGAPGPLPLCRNVACSPLNTSSASIQRLLLSPGTNRLPMYLNMY